MECLLDYSKEEMAKALEPFDIKGFRVNQIYTALYQGKAFTEMTTISALTKQKLQMFTSQPVTILDKKMLKAF